MSMVELLKTVNQAEQDAEQLVSAAHKEARRVLIEAEARKQGFHDEAKRQVHEMEKKLVEDARIETEQEVSALKQENERLIQEIRENAAQNMDAAVRFIAAKIMG